MYGVVVGGVQVGRAVDLGLLVSVMQLLKIKVPVPDYTTLCQRRRTLEVSLPRRTTGEPLHVVVDITGIKVFGEGEWKVRSHGWAKRRTWRKLHIGVDEVSSEIVAAAVTIFDFSDGQLLPDLLDQVGEKSLKSQAMEPMLCGSGSSGDSQAERQAAIPA
jgi:hypothetical protein